MDRELKCDQCCYSLSGGRSNGRNSNQEVNKHRRSSTREAGEETDSRTWHKRWQFLQDLWLAGCACVWHSGVQIIPKVSFWRNVERENSVHWLQVYSPGLSWAPAASCLWGSISCPPLLHILLPSLLSSSLFTVPLAHCASAMNLWQNSTLSHTSVPLLRWVIFHMLFLRPGMPFHWVNSYSSFKTQLMSLPEWSQNQVCFPHLCSYLQQSPGPCPEPTDLLVCLLITLWVLFL